MNYNFDQVIDRRDSDSGKWNWYGQEALPLWVADMDFVSPEPVIQALQERVEHGIFGYGMPDKKLTELISERMERLYQWSVTPEEIILLPGLVCGINVMCRAFGQAGDSVLVQTPVYPPFLSAPGNHGQELIAAPLSLVSNRKTIRYEINFEVFEAAIKPSTRLFILCNPHNPIGQSYSRDELSRMAEICLQHDIVLCSDEIHSDLLLDDTQHVPLASISPKIAQHCITLLAPSKTFNLPGLGCSMAIIQNKTLRERVEKAMAGIVPHVNVMGVVAAKAAYEAGQEWYRQMLAYIEANRDYAVEFIGQRLPGIKTTVPESTYLLWLDCREAGIEGNPHKFFLKKARVALNDGADFGQAGKGFVRLNLGCPRVILEQALTQMQAALTAQQTGEA